MTRARFELPGSLATSKRDKITPLEMALALVGGEFLEDNLYAEWSQGRRHTVSGALYRLVRL